MLPPFSPIVRERDYRSHDVIRLLGAAAALDVGKYAALLRPAPAERLAELDALPEFAPRYDCVVVAAALGLWNSAAHSNALVAAARAHFLSDMDEGRRARKAKLPLPHFFRFLNKLGVDVLVLTANRERGIALFARKGRPRCKALTTDTPKDQEAEETKEEKEDEKEEKDNHRKDCDGMERNINREADDVSVRTLLALEYDENTSLWCALRVAPRSTRGKDFSAETICRVCPASERHNSTLYAHSSAELTNTTRDAVVLEQTMYNPQRTAAQSAAELEPSPFSGMKYPTIAPMDFQLFGLLRRGLDPALRRNRLRFLASFPAALLAAALGVALLCCAAAALEPCCVDQALLSCAVPKPCADLCAPRQPHGAEGSALHRAPHVFLFGSGAMALTSAAAGATGAAGTTGAAGPGVGVGVGAVPPPPPPGVLAAVAVCCALAAAFAAAVVAVATARTVARERARPRFAFVAMGAQALLCAVACGLAAYVVYIFSARRHIVPCGAFAAAADANAKAECEALARLCAGHALQVAERGGEPRVVLSLSVGLLAACVAALAAALIPPMPRKEEVARMQKATPGTSVLYPNIYAPDGITEAEKDALRGRILRQLHVQLRQEVHQSEFLLTRSATIGEMMQANQKHSLGGYITRSGQAGAAAWQPSSAVARLPLRYMADEVSGNEADAASSEWSRSLSPKLTAEVEQISAAVCRSKRLSRKTSREQEEHNGKIALSESPT